MSPTRTTPIRAATCLCGFAVVRRNCVLTALREILFVAQQRIDIQAGLASPPDRHLLHGRVIAPQPKRTVPLRAGIMNEQLASSLKAAYRERRSGVLVAETRKFKRSLAFRDGFIVAARSNLKAEHFGQMLIRKGRITQQQLKDASVFIKSGWKMGDILAELRIIDKEEIASFVTLLVMDIACSMLLDEDSTFVFSELTEVEAVITKPLTVAAVLMEAGHRTSDIDAHLKNLRQENRLLELTPDPLIQFQDLSLTAEQGFLLSRIQGTEPPAAIFSLSPLSEEETARTLLGLLLTGIVRLGGESKLAEIISDDDVSEEVGLELAAPESPAPVAASREEIELLFDAFHAQDHWQLLGLSRGASAQDVKMAFHEKARRYHPDRYRSITDQRFHEELSYIFHRLQEAFETLSSDTGATRYATLTAKETEYATGTSQWEPSSKQAIAGESSPGGCTCLERSDRRSGRPVRHSQTRLHRGRSLAGDTALSTSHRDRGRQGGLLPSPGPFARREPQVAGRHRAQPSDRRQVGSLGREILCRARGALREVGTARSSQARVRAGEGDRSKLSLRIIFSGPRRPRHAIGARAVPRSSENHAWAYSDGPDQHFPTVFPRDNRTGAKTSDRQTLQPEKLPSFAKCCHFTKAS